jgi:hypothetical protein
MRRILPVLSLLLAATSAFAGVTSIHGNLVSVDDYCEASKCKNSFSNACSTNGECVTGSISPKSKLSLSSDGQFKLQLRDVLDVAGAQANGDYIFGADITLYPNQPGHGLVVRVPVVAGSANLVVDVSSLIGTVGDSANFYGAQLRLPPANPADCPGPSNSPSDLALRDPDLDCYHGKFVAELAVTPAASTIFKSNVVPISPLCHSGFCGNSVSCTTNTDCFAGSLSPKSRVSLSGKGAMKVQLKDVVDDAGMPASGNYMLSVAMYSSPSDVLIGVSIEIPVQDGKGKADADVSSLIGAPGAYEFAWSLLFTPPTVPADCTSGNDPADIVARQTDTGCSTGDPIGTAGILSAQ